jgi:antitoxin HicB
MSDERWSGRVSATGSSLKTRQELSMSKRYTVSDGKLVLNLEEAEESGYLVTSPLDPELITEAETLEEAFANARDAAKALKQSRARLMRRLSTSKKPGDHQTTRPE